MRKLRKVVQPKMLSRGEFTAALPSLPFDADPLFANTMRGGGADECG